MSFANQYFNKTNLSLRVGTEKEYLITCKRQRNINHQIYIESAEAVHNFSAATHNENPQGAVQMTA
jgi:hypothetical protein